MILDDDARKKFTPLTPTYWRGKKEGMKRE